MPISLFTDFTRQLSALYPEGEARAVARCVAEDRFQLSQTDLILGKDSDLSADDKDDLQNILSRLLCGEPVQYVLGKARFCGHAFIVRPGCLIPRPETEDLVRSVVEGVPAGASVLDIGTGSGCIAVSLSLVPELRFRLTAWDVSPEALAIARENAAALGADVLFELRDILHSGAEPRQWDTVVSNPPYVRCCEADQMERNVLDYEPREALFVPDDDPLLFCRAIGQFALSHLTSGGSLFMEINQYLSAECAALFSAMGFVGVEVRQDRLGNDRILYCHLP